MEYYKHPQFDKCVRRAIEYAGKHPVSAKRCFGVYFLYPAPDKRIVKPSSKLVVLPTENAPDSNEGDCLLIAQRWDDRTVQTRESGAFSRFVPCPLREGGTA